MSAEYSFFDAVSASFDKAAGYTKFDKGILEQIKQCNSVLRLHFPLRSATSLKSSRPTVCNTPITNSLVRAVSASVTW